MRTKAPPKPKKLTLKVACLRPEDPATASPERPWCARCEGYKEASKPFMPAQVPKDWTGKLMVVGERPGADEDQKSGHPFSGRSGKILREELAAAGFEPRDVLFTNITRCFAEDNRTPSMEEVRCCRPFLLWEIDHYKPETILAVGTTALRGLTNDGGATVTRFRGRPITVARDGETTTALAESVTSPQTPQKEDAARADSQAG